MSAKHSSKKFNPALGFEGRIFCRVSGMAHFLLVRVQSRVFTAKCSEPQTVSSNAKGGVSGVAKLSSLRTET